MISRGYDTSRGFGRQRLTHISVSPVPSGLVLTATDFESLLPLPLHTLAPQRHHTVTAHTRPAHGALTHSLTHHSLDPAAIRAGTRSL